jgi:hypothetical protein
LSIWLTSTKSRVKLKLNNQLSLPNNLIFAVPLTSFCYGAAFFCKQLPIFRHCLYITSKL